MLKNKTRIILLGALAVTVLMNFQRIIIALVDNNEIASAFGLTLGMLIIRMIIMFGYACLLLSFNILWKKRWAISSSTRRALNVVINFGIFMLGVVVSTAVKNHLVADFTNLEPRKLFLATVINYLIVHPVLILLARFINLSIQQQQDLLEKEQTKQKALHHQLQALRAQINPHFLFNALNSLTVLIRQQSARALPFVDQLSWLLRSTLQRSEEDFITIEDELEYLESYVFLQKERFGEKFKVDIRIPENWKKELIPSFSLQLLAENAIKHNIVSKAQPLLVEIYPQNELLIIRNLIQKRRDAPESIGTGLTNLSARFRLLKRRNIEIVQDEQFFTVQLPILTT